MIIEIPFQGGKAEDAYTTTILNVTYTFAVHWNYRENAWYFHLQDANGQPIISNVKIVLGAFLGRTAGLSPVSDGVFVATDTSKAGKEATFDDLGTRVKIRFITADTLIARIGALRG